MGRYDEARVWAIKNIKHHRYRQLSSGPSCEMWECSWPGCSTYAFTIMICRMGIAVVGDIDGLTFNVGSSYGIPFLAGDDVSYYIYSKLESHCRKEELDEENFQYHAIQAVLCRMDREVSLWIGQGRVAPKWVEDRDASGVTIREAIAWLEEMGDDFDYLADFLDNVQACHDLKEAYALIENDAPIAYDWWDCRLGMPIFSLMTSLYMVNHAAKQILDLKVAQAEAALFSAA